MGQPRINLNGVVTLLADSETFTRGLVAHMLRGYGAKSRVQVATAAEADAYLKHNCPDLIVAEAALPDIDGADFIRQIRRDEKSPLRFVPIIILTGYTQLSMVSAVRDAGASAVLKKPVSPRDLFDRIAWVARVNRPFVEADEFVGPDRRFRAAASSEGMSRRDSDKGGGPAEPKNPDEQTHRPVETAAE